MSVLSMVLIVGMRVFLMGGGEAADSSGTGAVAAEEPSAAKDAPRTRAAGDSQSAKPTAKSSSGDRWAILVGVDKYKHIRPELQYCGADVRALGEKLVQAGFGKERVVVLHDQAEPSLYPSKTNIEQQLLLTLKSAARGDFVFVAFSGHGVRLEQQSYLCPYDAKMDPADLISVQAVYKRLQECEARFKLFLVDACQDEKSRPKEVVATRSDGEVKSFGPAETEKLPEGILLLTSCAQGQKSVEEPKFGHGVFTHFLLEGLDGKADVDGSGSVSLLQWVSYASSKTRAYVRSLDRIQTPAMKGEFPDFELVRLSDRVSMPARPSMQPRQKEEPVGVSAKSPKEVLAAMVAAYKKAPSYADKGSLRVRAVQGGQKDERAHDYSLVFVRPNKIRLQVYGGVMVCDGRDLVAFANDLPDQVARRPTPTTIDIKTVFSDRILGSAVSQGPTQGFSWVPLALLLMAADDPLKTILYGSPQAVLLEPAKIGDHECYRIQFVRPDGVGILWIDQRSSVLRRMEFPVEAMAKAFGGQKLDEISMVAELQEAGLGDQVDDAIFRHEVPAKAKVGERLLPPPLLPLGKPAPEFAFVDADGKPIDSKTVAGKIAVLDFWATWCGPCRVSLPKLEEVYRKYKDNPKIRFVAVSVDTPKVENKELQATLDDLKVTIPFARDPEQHAGKRFGVEGIPSTYIVGPNNVVQAFERGYLRGLDDDLAKKIDGLLAGHDVYREQLAQFGEEHKKYVTWLDKWIEKGVFVAPVGEEVEIALPSR